MRGDGRSSVRSTDGVDIVWRVWGRREGDVVVLVNGLGDPMEAWDRQVPALVDAGFRVVTIDNRGIGRSAAPPGPYSIEQMAEDVHAVILAVASDRPFHLVGVSMGGAVAQRYAVEHPTGLASLTLVSTFARPDEHFRSVMALWRRAALSLGLAHVMRDAATRCLTPRFYSDDPEAVRDMERELESVDMTAAAFLAQLDAVEATDLVRELGVIRIPTLVVVAQDDRLIDRTLSLEIADAIPDARVVEVPGGHLAFLEHHSSVNDALLDHLCATRSMS